jgi:hypothetical protein
VTAVSTQRVLNFNETLRVTTHPEGLHFMKSILRISKLIARLYVPTTRTSHRNNSCTLE